MRIQKKIRNILQCLKWLKFWSIVTKHSMWRENDAFIKNIKIIHFNFVTVEGDVALKSKG